MPTRTTSTPRCTARRMARRLARGLLAAALAAAGLGAHAEEGGPGDPLEPINRMSHRTGLVLDKAVLGPVSRGYVRATPKFVRTGLSNFLDNLTYPSVILNDFLQGKFEQGVQDSMRFVFNTTFGLGGFIDFASEVGLERHDEDLGQTLAVWGVGEIAYLEAPGLGPTSVRDVGGEVVAWQTSLIALADISGLALPAAILGAVNARANADAAITFRNRTALDTYVFTREAYRARRNHLITDGEATEDDDDLYSARDRSRERLLALVDGPGSAGLDGSRYAPFPR